MKNILIVEDDRLVADVYSQKLRQEGFLVDVAADGKAGWERFHNRKVDLILLDLLLPEIDGVKLLKQIRAKCSPRTLPVLVFTNAYLGGAVQQAWEAGANQVIPKVGVTPNLVVQMVKNALEDPPPAAVPLPKIRNKAEADSAVRKKFLASAPRVFAALWRPLKQLVRQGYHPDNQMCFRALFRGVRPLTASAALAGLDGIAQMSAALEALLKDLGEAPERLSPSVVLTIAQAIDTLKLLFSYPDGGSAKSPSAARILVVDDDEFARLAITRALALADLKATCVDGPVRALKRRTGKRFDLIILDIEMPDANGFELCTRFRAMPAYRDTPIIFLSMRKDLKDRTESALRGGDDYITKPFLYMELATKALSFVISGSLKSTHARKRSNENSIEPLFSRRDLNSLKQSILGSYDS